MVFPDTWEEFEKSYGFTDKEKVYTNGSRLIPSFRVKQWLDHCKDKQTSSVWHTGTPTEAGLYLTAVKFNRYYAYEPVYWDGEWCFRHFDKPIVTWQRIEPRTRSSPMT